MVDIDDTETPFPHDRPDLTAVLVVNLGTPEAPTPGAVRRYLAEFLSDPRVVDTPRLLWWPIQWFSHYLEPLLPARTQHRLAARLRKAGLDYTLKPAQFVAARLVGALLLMVLATWGLGALARQGLMLSVLPLAALLGYAYPALWLGDRLKARKKELLKTLPFFLDIITLCVEAGLNLQGAMRHVLADLAGSVGVIAAAVVILTTGWELADPLIGAAIALLVAASAVPIIRDSTRVLLEAAPKGLDAAQLGRAMAAAPGVAQARPRREATG